MVYFVLGVLELSNSYLIATVTYYRYRVLVRKDAEDVVWKRLTTGLEQTRNNILTGKVVDAYYPKRALLKFNGKRSGPGLSVVFKPMVPGLLFVKMPMNADIADATESVDGVRGFTKDNKGRVVPLSEAEVLQLEAMRAQQVPPLDAEAERLRIGDYVSVVGGVYEGKYGIIEGAFNGKIQVQ
jgi:transcription antitermination factor NusG